jgi:hypothetical protein
MKTITMLMLTAGLLAIVIVSCAASEMSWAAKDNDPDSLRQIVGLPSLAIGNLNPVARNPGLELLCPALFDTPGGYCYYFTAGAIRVNFTSTYFNQSPIPELIK